jgi:hypothetical protein
LDSELEVEEGEGGAGNQWRQRKERSRQGRDGNRLDTHGIRFKYHFLPHFYSNTNTYSNVLEYEYKTDVSNSDTHSEGVFRYK